MIHAIAISEVSVSKVHTIDLIKYGVCEDKHLETLQSMSEDDKDYLRSFIPMIEEPPLNSSQTTRSEIEYLFSIQQSKRQVLEEQIIAIDQDLTIPFVELCKSLEIDPLFSDMSVVLDKGQRIALFYKAYFNRARPFQLSLYVNKGFAPMASISAWTPSYPSGHTIQAEMLCTMYTLRYPQYAEQFQMVSDFISFSRLVGGFHFESDIDVAQQIVKSLQ